METIGVFSSNGHLVVNKENGEVIECDMSQDGEGIDEIARFDLEEWKRYYPNEKLPAQLDILDLGSWNKDGSYGEPEMDWRKDMKEMRSGDYWKDVAVEQEKKKAKKVKHLTLADVTLVWNDPDKIEGKDYTIRGMWIQDGSERIDIKYGEEGSDPSEAEVTADEILIIKNEEETA